MSMSNNNYYNVKLQLRPIKYMDIHIKQFLELKCDKNIIIIVIIIIVDIFIINMINFDIYFYGYTL